jgi:hypothetical protein
VVVRVRPQGVRWAAGFFGFVFCVLSLALLDLVTGVLPAGDPSSSTSSMSNAAFGVLGLVLIGCAFANLVRRNSDATASLAQVAVVVLALIGGSLLAGAPIGVVGAAAVLVPLAVVWALHPDRRKPFRRDSWRFGGLWMLGCALVLVVPAWVYAAVEAAHGRAGMPPENSFAFIPSHWSAMTAALLATGLVALVAVGRGGGWNVSAVSPAVAVLVFAVASVVNPDVPSSGGRVWGAAAFLWVGVWLVAVRRDGRSAVRRSHARGREATS